MGFFLLFSPISCMICLYLLKRYHTMKNLVETIGIYHLMTLSGLIIILSSWSNM